MKLRQLQRHIKFQRFQADTFFVESNWRNSDTITYFLIPLKNSTKWYEIGSKYSTLKKICFGKEFSFILHAIDRTCWIKMKDEKKWFFGNQNGSVLHWEALRVWKTHYLLWSHRTSILNMTLETKKVINATTSNVIELKIFELRQRKMRGDTWLQRIRKYINTRLPKANI